jgi:Spy/CpxP family protein refolding chaperone
LWPGGEPPSAAKREEVRKKIETVRIWKLTEALKLDPDTSARVSAFINPLDQQRQEIAREQFMTMRELRLLLQSAKPDEAKVKASLDKLEKNRLAMQETRNREYTGLKNILTTEQQARFIIFQQDFRREMRHMISGAKGNGPGRGGMGPGGGRGMRGGQMQGGPGQQPPAQ